MTLSEILAKHNVSTIPGLQEDLVAREDEIADNLRQLGMQLGAMPEFVAKALMDVGLGTQPDATTRAFLDRQFQERLAWLQQQFGQGEGGS